MEAKLELIGLTKSYRAGFRRVTVFEDLDLTVRPGEFVAICGPSGCGKSTLLSMVAGLEEHDRGQMRVDGCAVQSGVTPDIGFVFQEPALLPWRTVYRNVSYGLDIRTLSAAKKEERVVQMLRLVGLEEYRDAYPAQLSGGMRQRVSLARALAVEPSLLLMDEPFSALDISTRQKMREELLKIWEATGITVLFVTHDIEEACTLATKLVVFHPSPQNGRTMFKFYDDLTLLDRSEVEQEVIALLHGADALQPLVAVTAGE